MNLSALLFEAQLRKVKLLETKLEQLTGKKVSLKDVFLQENIRQAKELVQTGKLSQKDFERIKAIDPTPNKKYMGWMARIWINEKPDVDLLRNSIEEFNTLLNKGKTKTKDISAFKTLSALEQEVDEINSRGDNLSLKELESDYEVIVDNADLYIAVPHTHEASRKLGLTKFSFRVCKDDKTKKDSAWCTTYKASSHFQDYYFNRNVTFYYILIRSEEIRQKLKTALPKRGDAISVVAFAVLENGTIDAYDGLDKQLNSREIQRFRDIVGV